MTRQRKIAVLVGSLRKESFTRKAARAIDIASRPYGKSAFDGKPAAVVSVTPGALGAFGANHHLRQSLVFLNMPVLQQPEMYLAGVGGLDRDRDQGLAASPRPRLHVHPHRL